MKNETPKEMERAMRFLSSGSATVRLAASGTKLLLDGGGRGTIGVARESFSELARRGLVVKAGDMVELTAAGAAFTRRTAGANPFGDQHRALEQVPIQLPEGAALATVNLNESPLAQLMRRRSKEGSAFLTDQEFRAGERLRSDYTRANIMPRLGANWIAAVAGGRRASGGSIAELTDAIVAARHRVDKAIAAVGPELSGVLIDVCCFLKGLETVETERRWPARSAKMMLKAPLGALGRHYEPPRASQSRTSQHWGAQGFRPSING